LSFDGVDGPSANDGQNAPSSATIDQCLSGLCAEGIYREYCGARARSPLEQANV